MSLGRGPKYRFARRVSQSLLGLEKERKILAKRKNPPGQAAASGGRRRKVSDFGVQLVEKQKLRYMYNISEKQLSRTVAEAKRKFGETGENLMRFLELRLDNAVFKMGFAPTIWAARQLVSHGHIQVNGSGVNVPSYQLRPGDELSVREKSRNMTVIRESLSRNKGREAVSYFIVDEDALTARVDHLPAMGEIHVPVNVQLVIEYYAR